MNKSFKLTCGMFVPPSASVNGVFFLRNQNRCVIIGHDTDGKCGSEERNPRYTYECQSEYVYTLTIPAENMTEIEQGAEWRCEYQQLIVDGIKYQSLAYILNISGKIMFNFSFTFKHS